MLTCGVVGAAGRMLYVEGGVAVNRQVGCRTKRPGNSAANCWLIPNGRNRWMTAQEREGGRRARSAAMLCHPLDDESGTKRSRLDSVWPRP